MPEIYKLPEIIGLPPWNLLNETNEQMLNSMPVATIQPCKPVFKLGLDLFTISEVWEQEYLPMLQNHGFEVPDSSKKHLKIAFIADSFPTDTFQNEYGENFIQSLSEVISEKGSSIAQFFGAESAVEAGRAIGRATTGVLPPGARDLARSIGGGVLEGAGRLKEALKASGRFGATAARGLDYVDALLAGARIDFPNVWKTSAFTPSYTMTVRLYNPRPRDDKSTMKYIVGPIVALMLLGIPRSQDGKTYFWPFLHRIKTTGVYNLDPAFISNITVVKGGDQQQISYNQRLGVADVRIDFGSLYNTIVAERSAKYKSGRPTLRGYIEGMTGKVSTANRQGERLDVKGTDVKAGIAPTISEYDAANPDARIPVYKNELANALKSSSRGSGGLTSPSYTEEEQ